MKFVIVGSQRACLLLVVAVSICEAAIRPHALISDNAVLRRGARIPVWGHTDSDNVLTVEFAGQKQTAKPQDGRFCVELLDLKPGGPHEMIIRQGGDVLRLKNILVGDVWLCGGQSNMQWPLAKSTGGEHAIASSANKSIRLFTVARPEQGAGSSTPKEDVRGKWLVCGPDTVADFSAVAYYFARELQPAVNLPLGLISSNVGGTQAERWIRRETLQSHPDLTTEAELRKAGDLFNAMIAPLTPSAIRGVIWYQGEANVDRAFQYRELLPALVNDWRTVWNMPELPFLIVQLAPVSKPQPDPQDSVWAELRESQLLASQSLFKAPLVVTMDVGDETVHSPHKKEVGSRLALAAQAMAYGRDIPYCGPICEGMQIEGSKVRLKFQFVGDGLEAKGGELKGFVVAGEDRIFHNANAKIEGDQVLVWNDDVPRPVAVRYGWAAQPVANLFNVHGLPASPFRTDAFKLLSQDRKK